MSTAVTPAQIQSPSVLARASKPQELQALGLSGAKAYTTFFDFLDTVFQSLGEQERTTEKLQAIAGAGNAYVTAIAKAKLSNDTNGLDAAIKGLKTAIGDHDNLGAHGQDFANSISAANIVKTVLEQSKGDSSKNPLLEAFKGVSIPSAEKNPEQTKATLTTVATILSGDSADKAKAIKAALTADPATAHLLASTWIDQSLELSSIGDSLSKTLSDASGPALRDMTAALTSIPGLTPRPDLSEINEAYPKKLQEFHEGLSLIFRTIDQKRKAAADLATQGGMASSTGVKSAQEELQKEVIALAKDAGIYKEDVDLILNTAKQCAAEKKSPEAKSPFQELLGGFNKESAMFYLMGIPFVTGILQAAFNVFGLQHIPIIGGMANSVLSTASGLATGATGMVQQFSTMYLMWQKASEAKSGQASQAEASLNTQVKPEAAKPRRGDSSAGLFTTASSKS